MLKNYFKIIFLVLLIVNLFLTKADEYCVCPKGDDNCEECLRLPIKFGKRLIFQHKMISGHEINAFNPKSNSFRKWSRIFGDKNISEDYSDFDKKSETKDKLYSLMYSKLFGL
jgi:hypothetical protein